MKLAASKVAANVLRGGGRRPVTTAATRSAASWGGVGANLNAMNAGIGQKGFIQRGRAWASQGNRKRNMMIAGGVIGGGMILDR